MGIFEFIGVRWNLGLGEIDEFWSGNWLVIEEWKMEVETKLKFVIGKWNWKMETGVGNKNLKIRVEIVESWKLESELGLNFKFEEDEWILS